MLYIYGTQLAMPEDADAYWAKSRWKRFWCRLETDWR